MLQLAIPLPRPDTLADWERFGGVVTPATFDSEAGSIDALFMIPDSPGFLDGVPLISESKPGSNVLRGWAMRLSRQARASPAGVIPDWHRDFEKQV